MSKNEEPADTGDGKRSGFEEPPDENRFSDLAAKPSLAGWKRKLLSLLAGESSETLYRLGSIEQYVKVLLAESKDRVSQYHFSEALSQVIQEWTPSILEPADRLNSFLSLITAFTPAAGFTKVLNHLNESESVKRSAERVSDEYDVVDLYKKGLLALARYYPNPPAHSEDDLGFQAYRELLERNLEDERYSGYAAVKLLQLKALNTNSQRFASLFLSSDAVSAEVFGSLIDLAEEPLERRAVIEKLGELLVICARADNLEKFETLASRCSAVFSPECDYQVFFPTLTLSDGTVLEIHLDMEDVRETALKHYVKHSRAKLHELLDAQVLSKNKISKYVSGYLTQVIRQPEALVKLIRDLETLNSQIRTSNNQFVLTVRRGNSPEDIVLHLQSRIQGELLEWIHRSSRVVITPARFSFSTTGGNGY